MFNTRDFKQTVQEFCPAVQLTKPPKFEANRIHSEGEACVTNNLVEDKWCSAQSESPP